MVVSLRPDQAERELLKRAIQINEMDHGEDHVAVANTLNSLGHAYGELGESRKQKELLERAFKSQERHHGEDHFEVAITMTNLGHVHGALGHPIKQRERERERERESSWSAPSRSRRHYGEDHFAVAITLTNLGNAYIELEDHAVAKDVHERALNIKVKHFGPDHFEVAVTLMNLRRLQNARGPREGDGAPSVSVGPPCCFCLCLTRAFVRLYLCFRAQVSFLAFGFFFNISPFLLFRAAHFESGSWYRQR